MGSIVSKIIKEREKELGFKLPKTDSQLDFSIKVTRADCNLAERGNPGVCVLARAARRVFDNVSEAWVYKSAVWLHVINEDGGEFYMRGIPGIELKKQIKIFDDVGSFESGTYVVHAPKGNNTLKAIDERSRKRKGRHQPADGKIRRKPRSGGRLAWSGK